MSMSSHIIWRTLQLQVKGKRPTGGLQTSGWTKLNNMLYDDKRWDEMAVWFVWNFHMQELSCGSGHNLWMCVCVCVCVRERDQHGNKKFIIFTFNWPLGCCVSMQINKLDWIIFIIYWYNLNYFLLSYSVLATVPIIKVLIVFLVNVYILFMYSLLSHVQLTLTVLKF
jgi:hypothetical protein